MDEISRDTILLVCACERSAEDILGKLYQGGFNVVGPAPNARMALLMAEQTGPTIAVVASPPNGRRNATELAGDLMRTWGIPSCLLENVELDGCPSEALWAADDDRVRHIRHALGPDAHTAETR